MYVPTHEPVPLAGSFLSYQEKYRTDCKCMQKNDTNNKKAQKTCTVVIFLLFFATLCSLKPRPQAVVMFPAVLSLVHNGCRS